MKGQMYDPVKGAQVRPTCCCGGGLLCICRQAQLLALPAQFQPSNQSYQRLQLCSGLEHGGTAGCSVVTHNASPVVPPAHILTVGCCRQHVLAPRTPGRHTLQAVQQDGCCLQHAKQLADDLREKVKALGYDRHKLVVQVGSKECACHLGRPCMTGPASVGGQRALKLMQRGLPCCSRLRYLFTAVLCLLQTHASGLQCGNGSQHGAELLCSSGPQQALPGPNHGSVCVTAHNPGCSSLPCPPLSPTRASAQSPANSASAALLAAAALPVLAAAALPVLAAAALPVLAAGHTGTEKGAGHANCVSLPLGHPCRCLRLRVLRE